MTLLTCILTRLPHLTSDQFMIGIPKFWKQLRRRLRSYFLNSRDVNAVPVENIISPPEVKDRGSDWEHRGNYFRRTLVITNLPEKVESPWLSRIQNKLPQGVTVSTGHIEPYDHSGIQDELVDRTSHLLSHESNLRHHGLRERFETESLTESTLELFEIGSDTSYFKVSIYFEVRAASEYGLDIATDYIYSIAESENFGVTSVKHRHTESFNTISPIGKDEINHKIIVDSETLSAITLPIPYLPVAINEEYISD